MQPPREWDTVTHGDCQPLHVRDELEHGIQFMRTAWEPEGQELGWLLAGGHLHVQISGSSHPVVNIAGQLPPEDGPPAIVATTITLPDGRLSLRVEMFFPPVSEPPAVAQYGWAEIDLTSRSLPDAMAEGIRAIESVFAERPRGLPPTGVRE